MLAVLGGLVDVERDLIRIRAAEGRNRAKLQGKHMVRPPSLTPEQQKQATYRRARRYAARTGTQLRCWHFHHSPRDERRVTPTGMNIDVVNKWLSAGASIAVILGVLTAIVGATVALRTLRQSQQIASADLVLKLRATLDDNKFAKLVADIQTHDHNYPLLSRSEGGKGGKWRDLDIEQYLSVFESIGFLVEDDLVISKKWPLTSSPMTWKKHGAVPMFSAS